MKELLDRVMAQTGLSQEQAKAAVSSVIAFLKERLPAPLASHLESLTGGGEGIADTGSSEGLAGKAAGALGSLFGSKG